jgi:hypothetical protein
MAVRIRVLLVHFLVQFEHVIDTQDGDGGLRRKLNSTHLHTKQTSQNTKHKHVHEITKTIRRTVVNLVLRGLEHAGAQIVARYT